jgi:hypothetical protein
MGLFDDIIKLADKGLQAVESGAVEKALATGVDKLEAGLDRAVENAEKVAAVPEKMLEQAEAKHEQITQVAQNVSAQAAKTIDVLQK